MTFSWLPPPLLVAGPCALEDDRLNLTVGETLAELQAKLGLRVLYKGSFDKANRSGPDAPRSTNCRRKSSGDTRGSMRSA